MRLSVQEYVATADALQAEGRHGADPAEQERLRETARLAKRLAELARERRSGSPQNTACDV